MNKAGCILAIIGGALGIFWGAGVWMLGEIGGGLSDPDTATEIVEVFEPTVSESNDSDSDADSGSADPVDVDDVVEFGEAVGSLSPMGIYGMIFSFGLLIIGIVGFFLKNWIPGAVALVAVVACVILGGWAMFIPMFLGFIGGVLMLVANILPPKTEG